MKVNNGARFARKDGVFAHVVHAMRAPIIMPLGRRGGKVSSVTLSAIDPAVLLPPAGEALGMWFRIKAADLMRPRESQSQHYYHAASGTLHLHAFRVEVCPDPAWTRLVFC